MSLPKPVEVDYRFENVGPWTILSYQDWDNCYLGQTTLLGGRNRPNFEDASTRWKFYSNLSNGTFHEAEQIHGNGLAKVGKNHSCHRNADGLLSLRSQKFLTIRTADCIPVFVKDKVSNRYALLHVGWRGLVSEIVTKACQEWFSRGLDVILGGGIHQEHYEVDEKVIKKLQGCFEASTAELIQKNIINEQSQLDLYQGIQYQLKKIENEVNDLRIVPLDTADDDSIPLPSYRKNNSSRRMISWICRRR